MAKPNEKLAGALESLRRLQQQGGRVFASAQFTRTARERLIKRGFLQEVVNGWLISSSPTSLPHDTTPWFASFWEFCSRYCDARFSNAWHLSPEQSLLLHAENTVIPKQMIVYSPTGNNNRIDLLFGTSLFALKQNEMPAAHELEALQGVTVFRVEAALTRVSETFFTQYSIEAQVVLGGIRDPSGLLTRLLEGGHSTIAGRLVGAFRRVGQPSFADEIKATMTAADYDVRETDPFDAARTVSPVLRSASPIVARIQTLWADTRETVIAAFPEPPGLPVETTRYLEAIDEAYTLDAYHSLSIEGYQVTPELVQRVAAGAWDSDEEPDRSGANAFAARGYYLAFQRVREAVSRILVSGDTAILRSAHREWYRELFSPNVSVGLLSPALLAGYRSAPVFLRGSQHIPPRAESVAPAMQALFDLIESEPAPSVRAVLGHWLIGYVHPFPDGNGRVARFVMNALLASGGYPWTVIRVDDRTEYLEALERASVAGDVSVFARFVAKQMERSGSPSLKRRRASTRRSR